MVVESNCTVEKRRSRAGAFSGKTDKSKMKLFSCSGLVIIKSICFPGGCH
jgi:hypothetical protein